MSLVEISRDPNYFLLRSEYFCVPRCCPPNYGAIWTEDDVRVRNVSYLYWAIVKSIFTETHFFLESFIRGVSNTPLNGVRLDGFLNITVGGPRKFIADRLDHAFLRYLAINLAVRFGMNSAVLNLIFLENVTRKGITLTNMPSAVIVTILCHL